MSTALEESEPETCDTVRGLFLVGGLVKEVADSSKATAIRDHLRSLLQVHNLVILVGSGASFHLGSPHTRGLTNNEVEALVGASVSELSEDDQVLLRTINPQDSGDLEKLLNGLQLASSLAQQAQQESVSLGVGEHNREFSRANVDSLRSKINRALANACRLPRQGSPLDSPYDGDPYRAHRTFMSRILRSRRSNLPRPRVFTTNYDLAIERALDELGYPYIDGFSGTVDRRLNLANYGLDFHRIEMGNQTVIARAEGAVYLHKVHGSVNWRASLERDRSTGLESLEVRQVGDEALSGELALIYPTTAKEGDTLAYPYADLLRLLGDAVQQEDTAVLVVGYGFADPHINRLVLRSLANNPALNIFVADPMGVLESSDLQTVLDKPGVVGRPLTSAGVEMKPTAIAALANGEDSRMAILTGDLGRFTELAQLIPDPSTSENSVPPNAVASWIEALEQSGRASSPSVPQDGELL